MVYDSNNPVFELHQFHRHQCETSGIRPVRQLVDVVGFPCQFADGVRILPVQPGYDLCRNNRLPYILTDTQPGFPGSLPDGIILQLGQLRTDNPLLLLYPFLCRTSPVCSYSSYVFAFNGILKIATNGRIFFALAKQGSFGLPKHNLALQNKPPAVGSPVPD